MHRTRLGLAAALVVLCSMPAAAQSVRIQFRDGLVTLTAQNAPVRAVLAEWARVGGATFVNADRVAGQPVTLELTDTPERDALETVLRGVSGYIAAARTNASSGASSFDRILILPTSAVSSAPAPQRAGAPPPAFTQPPPPVVFVPGDPEENPPDDIAPDDADQQPGVTTPAQLQQRLREAAARAAAQRAAEADPAEADPDSAPEAPATTPGRPFGTIRGSSRPGEITPVPQPQRPNPLRPNGDPEP
jgi:hypothetical protein